MGIRNPEKKGLAMLANLRRVVTWPKVAHEEAKQSSHPAVSTYFFVWALVGYIEPVGISLALVKYLPVFDFTSVLESVLFVSIVYLGTGLLFVYRTRVLYKRSVIWK